MKLVALQLGVVALFSVAAVGCTPPAPEGSEESSVTDNQAAKAGAFCGGFAGFACPDGQVCVDNPHDDCDPAHGGADCGGICKKHAAPPKKAKCNDPSRQYVANSPAECAVVKFYCAEGEPFFDACGCGCTIPDGDPCGGKTCGTGEYCCNDSCGTCAPIGAVCTQQFCGATTCGPDDCGPQLGLANWLCPDGVTVAGPTGNCVDQGGACGWEIASCP